METFAVQTKRQIRETLAAAGLRPRRRLGQHFLIDGNLMRWLADCADIRADDLVLEVGAGTGGLTDLLVPRAGHVLAVELDRDLHAILQRRFQSAGNLTLIQGDVLATKNRIAPAVIDALSPVGTKPWDRLLLVANLPYQIATPLLVNLLLEPGGFACFCFTVQRELGRRIEARAGSKDYGPLSVVLQATCAIKRLATVPASAFWPEPAVESAMYRLDVADHPFAGREHLRAFVALVRGAFLHRRKTLRYNLTHSLGEEPCRKAAEIVELSCRPEAVTPDEWVALANRLGESDV